MNSSQRIALNTVATYTRSVFAVGLALFSSRWVLKALGQTDFGLFSIVGSLVILFTFLNSVMSWSASRYFAYSIGQGDPADVNRWFNAALSIHLCLAMGLVVLGWIIGEYVISHILNIPTDRISTCLWVFRVSLISAFFSMVSLPFIAMFTAKQHFVELAFWGMLYSILVFTLALQLAYVQGDRLRFYATGMVAILIFVQLAQILRALWIFRECRIVCSQWFDMYRLKEILSFATWSLVGYLGGMLSRHGSAVLLNLYFGPNVNAAYGIANQVSAQSDQLAMAMRGAFLPEITSSEGRSDRIRMLSLSHRASKLGTILVIIFAIPLIAEMDYVLKLWLSEPPLHTAMFCRLILCAVLIDRLSTGYEIAVNAHGRIAGYMATTGTIMIMTFPLGWLFLRLGFAPTSISVALIITAAINTLARVLWVRHLFAVPVRYWLISVVFRCGFVACVAAFVALSPGWFLPPSFYRLIIVMSASIVASLLTTWFFAFDVREREFFQQNKGRLFSKISSYWTSSKKASLPPQSLEERTP